MAFTFYIQCVKAFKHKQQKRKEKDIPKGVSDVT